MTQAYPIRWPQGRLRKTENRRKRANFSKGERVHSENGSWVRRKDLTVSDAVRRVILEADRIGARGLVISSNVELRNDGLPRSGQREPADPGVCVYFDLDGKSRAMPCDTYDTVAGNIAAIAAHIEATRAIERYGVATIAEMFDGFIALPAPATVKPPLPWWEVLHVNRDATKLMVDFAYRELAKKCHPDVAGGSQEAMAELNRAKADALKAVANG